MGLKVYSAVVWVWAEATVNVSHCTGFAHLSLFLALSLSLCLSLSLSDSVCLSVCIWCGAHAEKPLDNAY